MGANLIEANLSNVDLWRTSIVQCDLRGADLRDAKLNSAHFWMSRLDEADLTGAAMINAKVRQSTLENTKLCRAMLRHAELEFVSLQSADLSETDLQNADIRSVDFTNCNLKNAQIGETVFIGCSFREAKGLDTVNHHKASTISIDTIYNSNGSLTSTFLQGSGVPAGLIDCLGSQHKLSEQFHSCFISYSSKDQEFAERLYTDLRFHNGVDCWFGPADLQIGERFPDSIEKQIRRKDKLIVILSKNSVNSRWVETEVRAALEIEETRHRPVLLPIDIDGAVVNTRKAWAAQIRRDRHIGKFLDWNSAESYLTGMDRLLIALKYTRRQSVDRPRRPARSGR